jgi:RNA polymerase sigma factor (sigma-70 family)
MLRSEAEVDRLVRENRKLVNYEVNRYLQRYHVGDMEREDLVSWGMIGLVHAARAWDPERSASFSTLACKVIERMIIRGVRREWRPEEAAATVSLDELMLGDHEAGQPARFVDRMAAAQNVEHELLIAEGRAAVRAAVAQLPPALRTLIRRHFFEDVSVARLAEEMGITRQGVYLRQQQAMKRLRAALSAARLTLLLLACTAGMVRADTAAFPDPVLDWNETALKTLADVKELRTPGASRALAMVHAAIFDAANAIDRRYTPYAVDLQARPGTSAEAAVAAAGHAVLVSLYPADVANIEAAYAASLAPIPDGTARNDGMALGEAVAARILALRSDDGSGVSLPYTQPFSPGVWQPLPPASIAAFVAWGKVMPFTLRQGSQFRPAGPPALTSSQYTADFNEVKSLGGLNSAARTADQSQAAFFWVENPPITWNNIARITAEQKGTTLSENARLFALLNLSGADSAIAAMDAKYTYNFWRPWAAIPMADLTGNPNTIADPDWKPLGPAPYPPHPDFVSQHSTYSAAAATVLASFFGTDNIGFSVTTSSAPNGAVRSFNSFSQAAQECSNARVWIGWHFRTACRDGASLGREIGHWTFDESLQPVQ